ncbi:hypothetical protein IGS60_07395 [Janthinobacterium sp. FW305-128]|nr:hypothetical protein [Janthinobacterium sp. FW305-128]
MLKDKETDGFVDYFFIANLWCKATLSMRSFYYQCPAMTPELDLKKLCGKSLTSIVQMANGLKATNMRRAESGQKQTYLRDLQA